MEDEANVELERLDPLYEPNEHEESCGSDTSSSISDEGGLNTSSNVECQAQVEILAETEATTSAYPAKLT